MTIQDIDVFNSVLFEVLAKELSTCSMRRELSPKAPALVDSLHFGGHLCRDSHGRT